MPSDAPIAIVVPHAGLKYSGPVAAFAYRAVESCAVRAPWCSSVRRTSSDSAACRSGRAARGRRRSAPVQVAEDLARAIAAASGEVIEHPRRARSRAFARNAAAVRRAPAARRADRAAGDGISGPRDGVRARRRAGATPSGAGSRPRSSRAATCRTFRTRRPRRAWTRWCCDTSSGSMPTA